MNISFNNTEIEINNEKLDVIFEEQKTTIEDVVDIYENNKDMQGLLYFVVSWNSLTKDIMESLLEKFGTDKIIKILNSEGN